MKNRRQFCPHPRLGNHGFTLVEMMIAMVVSSLIMGAVYMAYTGQQKSYVMQEQVAEMQQNLRAATLRLYLDIRQAGCDPTEKAFAGVVVATATRLQFTSDIAGDPINANKGDGDLGDANENVTFGLAAADDVNGNGIADGGVAGADWSTSAPLGRDTGGGFQPIAENIEAVEFAYVLNDGTTTTAPADLNAIRVVQVTLLARSARPDPDGKFVDRSTYTTAAGTVWDPPDDHFRRRFLIITIKCRNLGG